MSDQLKPLTIWRITDGKAGHDTQSLGLTTAMSVLTPCRIHDIKVPPRLGLWPGLLTRDFNAGKGLPDPDLIIGAGHQTHLVMLLAKAARGGRAVVLMKPSLPTSWFDLCLIPEHDKPPQQNNILPTCGALNTIVPSTAKEPGHGLLLIGGPSRHYNWDEATLLAQINRILDDISVRWTLTDSPRTPASTRRSFANLHRDNLLYRPYADTSRDWLAQQLSDSAVAWVTEDSVTMLYEALTAGAAVGVLSVPLKKPNRIAESIQQLANDKMITRFDAWTNGHKLKSPDTGFNESLRCANRVLQHFSFPVQRT